MTPMLALTQVQGVILAAGGAVILIVAVLVLRARGRTKAEAPDIPPAMRPGPSDPDLETPLLQKLQGWGVLLVAFFVIWMPLTWLREPSENLAQEKTLKTDSIARGELGVGLFSEENQTGIGCIRCHGVDLKGMPIQITLPDGTQSVLVTPNLTTVCGGPFTGHPLIYSLRDIFITIEQGRNVMPSWSIRYAGALDDQQIQDIVNYIISIQEGVPKSQNVCINSDATQAAVDKFGPPKAPPTSNAQP